MLVGRLANSSCLPAEDAVEVPGPPKEGGSARASPIRPRVTSVVKFRSKETRKDFPSPLGLPMVPRRRTGPKNPRPNCPQRPNTVAPQRGRATIHPLRGVKRPWGVSLFRSTNPGPPFYPKARETEGNHPRRCREGQSLRPDCFTRQQPGGWVRQPVWRHQEGTISPLQF